MTSKLRLLFLLPLAALVACGPNTIPGAGGTSAAVTGDYVLTVGVNTANAIQVSGGLYIQGSSVSGAFLYNSIKQSSCKGLPISVTGTINSGHTSMTLTSSSFASGSVATFTIPLPLTSTASGGMYSTDSGTAVIVGGDCPLASTALQAFYVSSFTGTWSATFTNGSTTTGTASLSVSAPFQTTTTTAGGTSSVFAANASGQFPATGSFSYSATGCTIPTTSLTGLVSGYTMSLTDSTSTYSVSVNRSASPGTVSISGGCTNGASGTISQ